MAVCYHLAGTFQPVDIGSPQCDHHISGFPDFLCRGKQSVVNLFQALCLRGGRETAVVRKTMIYAFVPE